MSRAIQELAEQLQEDREEGLTFEEASRQVALGWAIRLHDVDAVRQYLEEGYDPNRSRGDEGWISRTPLNIIAGRFFDTYVRMVRGREIPDPPPDVAMLQLLVDAGADVNQRPYIWFRVHKYGNNNPSQILRRNTLIRTGWYPETEAELEELAIQRIEHLQSFVSDANRVIEAFIRAGADPDMRGHPTPFGAPSIVGRMTDTRAAAYFAVGSRPINEAIRKGIWWESQVDLLLRYVSLDEDSLVAARESDCPAMLEKITRLWRDQQAGQ